MSIVNFNGIKLLAENYNKDWIFESHSLKPLFLSARSGCFSVTYMNPSIHVFPIASNEVILKLMLNISFRVWVVFSLSFFGNSPFDFWISHKFFSCWRRLSTVVSSQLRGVTANRSLPFYSQGKSWWQWNCCEWHLFFRL